jgi:hypothetical protein
MMLLGLILIEAACCLAAAGLLVRLWRPALSTPPESFASVMARLPDEASRATATPARPVSAALAPPIPPVEGDSEAIEGLALSKRLAVLRHMLQGRTAAEIAATEQVDVAAALAIFRAHGRFEG